LHSTKLDSGVAVGVAVVPFTIALSLGGFWADRARSREGVIPKSPETNAVQITSSPVSGTVAGANFGSNGDFRYANISLGTGGHQDSANGPKDRPGGMHQIVFGEIPQQSISFEDRPELQDKLMRLSSRDNLVFAVTGIRGAGKSQLASSVARRRMAEGWRLVGWIDAENQAQMLDSLARLAAELGISSETSESKTSALRLRNWLESDGAQCLLVLDNAVDADIVRPVLPVIGRAQIIVTSSRQALANLGYAITVGAFSSAQAVAYLTHRTGNRDEAGARAVAEDLDCLPLALSQAAAVIVGQNLQYATYRERLANLRITDYLAHTQGDTYPLGLAEAIMLSITAIEEHDAVGLTRQMLEFSSILSPAGISRQLLYSATEPQSYKVPEDFKLSAAIDELAGREDVQPLSGSDFSVDEALRELVDSSVITWDVTGTAISLHRLVARTVRERAIHDGTMSTSVARAIDFLAFALNAVQKKEHAALLGIKTQELVNHVSALGEYEDQFRDLLSPAHRVTLIVLKLYDSAFRAGKAHEGRRLNANKLAEEGRYDEAIHEFRKLLAETKGEKMRAIGEFSQRVEADLRRTLRRKQQTAKKKSSD